jgi:hypothetical protein
MAQRLVRIAYRAASWEPPVVDDLDRLIAAEFRDDNGAPDRAPSAYLVADEGEALRAYVEHVASQGLGLRGTAYLFDVTDLSQQVSHSEGTTRFAFSRGAHREILLPTDDELRVFAGRLATEQEARRMIVTKKQVREYVAAQLAVEDAEWLTLKRERPDWPP